jgi:hypothetical protein
LASAAGREVGRALVKKDTLFAYKSPFSLFIFSVIALSMSAHLHAYAGGGDGEPSRFLFSLALAHLCLVCVGNFISGVCLIGRGSFGSNGPGH